MNSRLPLSRWLFAQYAFAFPNKHSLSHEEFITKVDGTTLKQQNQVLLQRLNITHIFCSFTVLIQFASCQTNPPIWAVSVTIFPEIFRYTFPLAQPQSAHAWTLASLKASVSEHYVIRICASVEIPTANPIKWKKRRVTCLVMITHMKSVVDS